MVGLSVLTWNRQQVTTFLTMVIVGVWLITAIVRLWVPWPVMHVLDAAMPMVIGYWFFINAGKKDEAAAT